MASFTDISSSLPINTKLSEISLNSGSDNNDMTKVDLPTPPKPGIKMVLSL